VRQVRKSRLFGQYLVAHFAVQAEAHRADRVFDYACVAWLAQVSTGRTDGGALRRLVTMTCLDTGVMDNSNVHPAGLERMTNQ
jgi:hypothetical protein